MALIVSKEFKTGLICPKSYCKILYANCTNQKIEFDLGVYIDKENRLNKKDVLEVERHYCKHDLSEDSKNCLRQAYEYLKTTDDYKHAIDDLEY